MREYSIFSPWILSFFSPSIYKDVVHNWRGTGGGYLFLIFIVFYLIFGVKFFTSPKFLDDILQFAFLANPFSRPDVDFYNESISNVFTVLGVSFLITMIVWILTVIACMILGFIGWVINLIIRTRLQYLECTRLMCVAMTPGLALNIIVFAFGWLEGVIFLNDWSMVLLPIFFFFGLISARREKQVIIE